MRIEINVNGKPVSKGKAKKVAGIRNTGKWDKFLKRFFTSRDNYSAAGVVWSAVDTTIISTAGSRHNDQTLENRYYNLEAGISKAYSIANAGLKLGAYGANAAVAGVTIGLFHEALKMYQNNTNWKIDNIENQLRQAIAMERLGIAKTDMNRS